ncbi:cubilin-like [Mercenaria mercenaria]|uniref:cubilin-like n=1 Tax=Mercenaria mercenaria TaxID=6596 RepID=UPI00234F0A6D|nr:cubilin-like [Mercenaria mercenaria]
MKYQLFCIFLSILGHYAAAITYEYMDEICNQDIDLGLFDSVRLKLTSSTWYKRNMNCYIRVKTDSLSRIMFYFKNFDVDSTLSSCTNDWLEVRDGEFSTSSYVSGLYGKQCGYYMSSTVRKTSGNYLYLKFVSDSSVSYDSGFDMVLTSYHTGLCYSYEYSCDNGRCISDSLTCNGYNPCGDYSDCSVIIAGGAIAGIAIGSVVFVTILSVVIVIMCRRRRLAYVGTAVHQPVNVVATTTGYNQPVPQQYPPQYIPQPQQAYPAGQYPQY